ncbi:hypothetical protein Palpr_0634 [Paludibacter propionicigenes WB4]|uniref:Uncharacterized protein n=1 Tax=Paludibacter propionicigenes (strain DSM 17365 / JCM 13257 / WB4) TaxID=694427 RepID=E4T246_PALPW|nr:hypothetical protein [Paludibacter propionicigenes]ADQ78790.1 hypothetical protein Palpr_0634 [Paludibacter propionicigenes WB4]
MDLIEFKNIEIFEINGSSKIKFEGLYSPIELAREFTKRWIPYYECHKCGKGDYCKFAIPYFGDNYYKQDIQCGVAKKALENYILRTFHVLNNANKQKQQNYVDSAFYFFKYIYLSEQLNGLFINDDKLEYLGKYSISLLTEILSLRDVLNKFGKDFKMFSELYNGQSLLLVEGKSELKFIEYLGGDDILSNSFTFIVESYNGKGNKLPKRIEMLIEDYQTKGYSIYIQGDEDGDGDGSGYDKFKYYVDKGTISKKNIFQFKYDFESSIPIEILFHILQELGYLKDNSLDDLIKLPKNKSINTILKEKFDIDTEKNKLKTQIAKKIGNIIFNSTYKETEKYNEFELFKFTRFLDRIK